MGVWDRDVVMNEGWGWGLGAGFGVQGGNWGTAVGAGQNFGCRTEGLGYRSEFGVRVRIWGAGGDSCASRISHEHHAGALIEDSQVIPEHIPVEGGRQESPVPRPALSAAQQQPLPWGGDTGVCRGHPGGCPCPPPPLFQVTCDTRIDRGCPRVLSPKPAVSSPVIPVSTGHTQGV